MKVFIGWSGQTSKEVASILKVWLPQMNSHIETILPPEISVGAYWHTEFIDNMREADAALLCVTRENLNSPWWYYEAGFLMGMNVDYVAPVLFDVAPSQVGGPPRLFPFVTMDKDSLLHMAYDLNRLCGENQCPPDELKRRFDGVYPAVAEKLAQVRASQKELPASDMGDAQDLKREIVAVNNKLDAILSRLDGAVPFPPESERRGLA